MNKDNGQYSFINTRKFVAKFSNRYEEVNLVNYIEL